MERDNGNFFRITIAKVTLVVDFFANLITNLITLVKMFG